jgi:putative hydrolase of the HAD superfamily
MKAIIFDFFGVFCAESAKYWYEAHTVEEPYEELRARIIHPYDEGILSAHDAYEELGRPAHMTGSEVHADWLARATVDGEMIAYARELSARYPIALCTNANTEFLHEIFSANGLDGLFPILVVSSEEHLTKPDPKIYTLTLERMGCTPEETVFVDDRPINVAAAETLGMKGAVYTGVGALREELAALGMS